LIQNLKDRFSRAGIDIRLFLAAIAIASFAGSIVNAIFNNFLNESYSLSNSVRTLIEVPREIPGLIVMFVSALLFFLCNRRLAAFAMLLASIGLAMIAHFSTSFTLMLVWLFTFSLGQHLMIPLQSSIGMELAKEGQTGRRLGQVNSISNLFAICGGFFVFMGFRFMHLSFATSFVIAAAGFMCAGLLLYGMKANKPHTPALHMKLHKEYGLFYWLSILYGTRKQIFLTFAPWVLVRIYNQPTQMIATLLTIGGILGIVLQPLLGRLIDSKGERFVLAGEAVVLIGVCVLYGFAGRMFPPAIALIVVASCYVADQLLISVGMARATYLKKIALHPDDVTPALQASTSIDHVFSISTALVSGLIWDKWGYQYVFLLGAGIAIINVFSALLIRLPAKGVSAGVTANDSIEDSEVVNR
jgi:predicted MFS family arabinose efflux permease